MLECVRLKRSACFCSGASKLQNVSWTGPLACVLLVPQPASMEATNTRTVNEDASIAPLRERSRGERRNLGHTVSLPTLEWRIRRRFAMRCHYGCIELTGEVTRIRLARCGLRDKRPR